ncbi:hypothetical protein RHGRI_013474 [Rhododendron griersonianum]|uniref:Disease resistance protein At4g27190-like leucine-rich repeats domain-containing protein n=1 Tax=Rhododendron griersonianum TaxID=479676 RepID=A0AAV6K5Y1_9ERIC|nr:hypothetical protein RHGRI_013474 [Rhododendron griersonianum]
MARRLLGQNPDTLEEARDIVCSVVNTLKTSCLLLDGENVNFVKMHDIVRDVAISIAKEEKAFLVKHGVKEWPETGTYEKYSAISLRSKTIHELPDELVCPELHTLMLKCSNSKFYGEPSIEIPDMFFRGTEKLTVLELNKVAVFPPSSLGKLKELRMLCLINCKLGDIAILKHLKNKLEVLRLRGSDIKALPPEVGELTCLRLLDMGDCGKLKVIPNGVISKLHRLEELHFPHRFKNWKATIGNEEISKVSLDELMSLARLSTLDIHIPHPRLMPIGFGLVNLIRFNITVGGPSFVCGEDYSSMAVMVLNDIDDDFNILERLLGKPKWSIERGGRYPSRSFNNLTQVTVSDCRLKYLFSPSCARGLLQLQRLVIIGGSEIMEAVIGNEGEKDEEIITNVAFPALQELYIHSVPAITAIWDMHTFPVLEKAADSSFSQLRMMQVSYCSNLVNVVQGFPNMEVRGAEEIEEEQVDYNYVLQFPQLRILTLYHLGRLSSFNDTSIITETRPLLTIHQVAFPALEELSIFSVPNITEIWDKNLLPAESFCLLRSLKVWGCEKLMNVVPSHMLPLLRNIKTLDVYKCPKMEVIVVLEKREEETQEATNKDIIMFPELTKMTLYALENLKGVCAYKSEDQLNFNVKMKKIKMKATKIRVNEEDDKEASEDDNNESVCNKDESEGDEGDSDQDDDKDETMRVKATRMRVNATRMRVKMTIGCLGDR